MFALLKKEIFSYFNSLTAYLVIIVFLLANSLFLWVFPGEYNVFDFGYSNLDGLFAIAPFVFLFLVPAISMKLFAEEQKSGTLEILLTKPLSDLQIILAKYLAGYTLIILSIIPTLIYYYSVYQLGFPKGNLDFGGFWGSFIGLLLLGASFMSIGIFTSSLTDNQIIAFIIAVFLCGFIYLGFNLISTTDNDGAMQLFINSFGIQYHYKSISRGVIDSRDLIYFVSLIIIFIMLTKLKLESRKW
jgi:ABC-2 type transport system permease protein